MQTVTLPNRLLDQAKAAAGTRSARAVVIRALEKFIAQETEYQPGSKWSELRIGLSWITFTSAETLGGSRSAPRMSTTALRRWAYFSWIARMGRSRDAVRGSSKPAAARAARTSPA